MKNATSSIDYPVFFGTWRIICSYFKTEHHTMIDMSTMFIEKNGEYFYLYDERDKIDDIQKMPNYIKEDWINYNRKDIDLRLIDEILKHFSGIYQDWAYDVVSELKSIRRDILIKKVI